MSRPLRSPQRLSVYSDLATSGSHQRTKSPTLDSLLLCDDRPRLRLSFGDMVEIEVHGKRKMANGRHPSTRHRPTVDLRTKMWLWHAKSLPPDGISSSIEQEEQPARRPLLPLDNSASSIRLRGSFQYHV